MSASRRPTLRSTCLVALTVFLAATVCLRAPALAALDKREVEARKDFAAGRYEQAADLFAELYEVQANGSAVLLASSAVRLRYRRGGTAAAMMVPGQPARAKKLIAGNATRSG